MVDRAEETRRNNAQEFSNHVSPWVAPSDQFLGAFIFNTYSNRPQGGDVVVVLSAMGKSTDGLIALADGILGSLLERRKAPAKGPAAAVGKPA